MFPPHPFPVDSIRIVPGVTPLQIPPENLPVIRSWTTLQQRVALPQPQGCLGYAESVPVDFVPNRPSPTLLHPPRRQSGAISRVRFFQCFTGALSDVVRIVITAGPTIQNLARDEYVAASTYAFEPNFGQCGTGHSYEVYFQLQVLFQDLQSVTGGFGIHY